MANPEWHYLYKGKRWEALRQQTLLRDLYQCQRCGVGLVSGRKSPRAAVVHHKEAHKGDLKLFWDPENLISTCKACHDGPIQSEEKSGKKQLAFDERGFPIW